MTGALVILAALIVIGFILFLTDRKYYGHHHSSEGREEISDKGNDEVCCGMHLVCEKTSLSPVSPEIIYYDDEELDRFIGRQPQSYSDKETEEFRDVLMTLLPEDIPGWARSITLRKIELPEIIRDELLMIVREMREAESTA